MKKREKYSNEFMLTLVGFLKSGQPIEQVAKDYDIKLSTLKTWNRNYTKNRGFGSESKHVSSPK